MRGLFLEDLCGVGWVSNDTGDRVPIAHVIQGLEETLAELRSLPAETTARVDYEWDAPTRLEVYLPDGYEWGDDLLEEEAAEC